MPSRFPPDLHGDIYLAATVCPIFVVVIQQGYQYKFLITLFSTWADMYAFARER